MSDLGLPEQRFRYEEAMKCAEKALSYLHMAFKGSNKTLNLVLAVEEMKLSNIFLGPLAEEPETLQELRGPRDELRKRYEDFSQKLSRLRSQEKENTGEIIEVKFG